MKIVGEVTEQVSAILGVSRPEDCHIYFSPSNLQHMQTSHPDAYRKYGSEISNILAHPDYVGRHPSDGSIEYVKEFYIDNEYVKVAVRLSNSGRYFARSLYILNNNRVRNFIAKGTLKKT